MVIRASAWKCSWSMWQTYESASPAADDYNRAGKVRRAVWKGVTCVVNNRSVVASREDGQSSIDRQGERREVRDRVVRDAVHGRVLQRDDRIVQTSHRDRVDGVSGA